VVVALAFQPVREWARRLADRLVLGKRATPYEALAEFSEHASREYSPDAVLPRMARIVAEGTGARSTLVWLRVGASFVPSASWPASEGTRPDPVPVANGTLPALPGGEPFPVVHGEVLLGAITVEPSPAEPLTPTKEKLILHVAAQAALVLRNVQLIEELKASRQRIVAAQDDERRRIERALRDGVERQLLGIREELRAAKAAAMDASAGRAEAAVRGLLDDADDAVDNLRVLGSGIYPPVLTRHGIAVALDTQLRGGSVPVEIEAEALGRYSQEVEAAVYFCALEALQNTAKYAQASRVRVRLAADDSALTFEVADDGRGFDPATAGYGTGLRGIADRLEAVGGSLDVRSTPGKGTTVLGRVPTARVAREIALSGAGR
jgi:signal transduction histidine kinase